MSPEFQALVAQTAHDILLWVGFGTLVGLAAKAIMPGRDPGGAVATLMTGIAGSVIGCGVLMFFHATAELTPISFVGFLAGTGGAFVLLFFYRVLSGTLFTEAEDGETSVARRNRKRRKEVLIREGN
jgi:uncharacterized membrane protein YeaQ/YmgE (transglycosylase-associated protein family)